MPKPKKYYCKCAAFLPSRTLPSVAVANQDILVLAMAKAASVIRDKSHCVLNVLSAEVYAILGHSTLGTSGAFVYFE